MHQDNAPYAIFDFDSTLVPCKGRGPAPEFSVKLVAKMFQQGNNIVIISNRSNKDIPPPIFAEYLDLLKAELGTTKQVATVFALYSAAARKPQVMAWKDLQSATGAHVRGFYPVGPRPPYAVVASFYCGDAAGRVKGVNSADYSSADIDFAYNCGLTFVTAEALFGAQNCSRISEGFPLLPWCSHQLQSNWGVRYRADYDDETKKLLDTKSCATDTRVFAADMHAFAANTQVIIMVGSPASGKTYLAKQAESVGYTRISGDQHGVNWILQAVAALKAGKKVVIDNTHPTNESREFSIKLARDVGVPSEKICIAHASTPVHMCMHLNEARIAQGAAAVPKIAIHVYWKKFEKIIALGGVKIVEVPFVMAADAPVEVAKYMYRLKGK